MGFLKGLIYLMVALALVFVGRYIYFKPKYKTGILAPNFEFTDLAGNEKTLESFQGRYVLLDFWASWCPPCRKENPELVKLYDQFKNENFKEGRGLEVISIALETSSKSWELAREKDHLDWVNHMVSEDRFNAPIAKLYGVREIPTKYLINPEGKIVLVNPNFTDIRAFLDRRK